MKMTKKNSLAAHRAWNFLRFAVLWARKGGRFRKHRIVINLNVFGESVRKILHSKKRGGFGALAYGDREFSFGDTPIIHVKMHRPSSMRFKMPHIPCINPQVDFDYDFEEEDRIYADREAETEDQSDRRRSVTGLLMNGVEREEEDEEEEVGGYDEGIDLKEELFIAKFYEQMRMQRQKSYRHTIVDDKTHSFSAVLPDLFR